MACLPLPDVDLPTLPSPLTITPPSPSLGADVSAELCCKLVSFDLSVFIVIPIPPLTINPAVIALINEALDKIDAFLDALPLDCPRE